MRTFLAVLALTLMASLAVAGDHCGGGGCGGGGGGRCGHRGPDWAYTYEDSYFTPDCSPRQLECFHDKLISMVEARKSHESSYIREHAERLYQCAKRVAKADCCPASCGNKKHYKRAAKDLVRDCDDLREISFGGSTAAVYERMKVVEEDYIRLINLCD
jgi:hypothetical protein